MVVNVTLVMTSLLVQKTIYDAHLFQESHWWVVTADYSVYPVTSAFSTLEVSIFAAHTVHVKLQKIWLWATSVFITDKRSYIKVSREDNLLVKEKTLQKRMTGTREGVCNRSILHGSSFGTVFKKKKAHVLLPAILMLFVSIIFPSQSSGDHSRVRSLQISLQYNSTAPKARSSAFCLTYCESKQFFFLER